MDHSAATASVKITVSGSKRRVRLTVPLRFSQLYQYVRSTFPDIKDFNLQYVDDEGDTIIVGNNDELVEAQNVFKDLGRIPSFTVNKLASPPPTAPSDVRPPLGRMHCEKRRRFGPCGRGNISGRQSLAKVMEFPISKAMASHFAKTGFPVLHLGITCDVSGQHPLIGTRYHKIGENYDLNEAEFAKLTREEQEAFEVIGFMGARPIPVKSLKPNQAIHFGVICDKSNQNPLLGVRYHKIGQNYDLNEDEFPKLTTAEQKKYEMISRPGATPVPVLNAGPDCVFVRDVTISDGQVISPDTVFLKTWLVKTGVNGWPAGCKLTNIDGNKMSSSGSIVLGPQKPHKLVEVSIPLTAPSRPGKITSKWRFLGPNGNFFGHSLWTTIEVKPSGTSAAASTASCAAAATCATATSSVSAPPVPPVTSAALQQLLEMGFNLPVEMLQRVLDSVGGNVPAAITALCRRNR